MEEDIVGWLLSVEGAWEVGIGWHGSSWMGRGWWQESLRVWYKAGAESDGRMAGRAEAEMVVEVFLMVRYEIEECLCD